MKEQPKGPFGRATAVAEGVAAAVRRRQRDREPRVAVHLGPGRPHLLAPGAKGHDSILDLAERMVETVDEGERPPRPARGPRARRAAPEPGSADPG